MALGAATTQKPTTARTALAPSPPTEIPDKLMFRIGEVSRIVGVETYVLRYWETEFPQLSPKKSGSGHRMYRRKEVEQLLLIRDLLYERQYTIKGARNYLRELARRRGPQLAELHSAENSLPAPSHSHATRADTERAPAFQPTNFGELREELRRILALLG